MTMVPGRLDQRLAIYEQIDNGADGFARPVMVWRGEFWGRIDATADAQTVPLSPQSHVENRQTARAMVADYVDVPAFGALRVDGTGDVYWVRGVVPLRQLRAKRIDLEWINPTEAASFVGFEAQPVQDGAHFLRVTDGFSTGFSTGFA